MRHGRVFEGWFVVAAVFLVLMVNAGLGFYGLAVYLRAITEEQGWTTGSVSLATSLFFVVGAITGRVIAPVIEQRDIRHVIGAGAVMSAVGLLLVGRATRLLTLYPSYVIFAIGFGLSGLVPATTLVTRWFQVRRSVALSVASTGLSIGGLTFTVLAGWMIDRRGMAGAMPWLSVLYLVVIGVAMFALWPNPEARGQRPDGNSGGDVDSAQLSGEAYGQAIRTPFFRLVTLGFVFSLGSQVGAIAQLAKLGTERVDSTTGTLLVSVVAGSSVIARLVGGVLASRVRLVVMTGVVIVVQAIGLVWLSVAEQRLGLIGATAVFGATIGNVLMLQPLVLADRFGVAHYPRIFALSQLVVTGLGVAIGPYLLGVLHDVASYRLSYAVASVGSMLGAITFFAAWRTDQTKVSSA